MHIKVGMYDTFGDSGDQLKIFTVPCYYFSQDRYNKFKETGEGYSFLDYMGGNLRSYAIGSEVPWRAMSYNYTENFTVIDVDTFYYNDLLFYFKDGIFEEMIEIDNSDDYDWSIYDKYFIGNIIINAYGDFLRIHNGNELKRFIIEYKDTDKKRNEILKKISNVEHIIFDYMKTFRDDEKKTEAVINALTSFEGIYSIAFNEVDLEMHKYYNESKISLTYGKYRAYLELVKFHSTKDEDRKDHNAALLHEAKEYIVEHDLRLEDFFSWNQTPEEDKPWIRVIDKKIREG